MIQYSVLNVEQGYDKLSDLRKITHIVESGITLM